MVSYARVSTLQLLLLLFLFSVFVHAASFFSLTLQVSEWTRMWQLQFFNSYPMNVQLLTPVDDHPMEYDLVQNHYWIVQSQIVQKCCPIIQNLHWIVQRCHCQTHWMNELLL